MLWCPYPLWYQSWNCFFNQGFVQECCTAFWLWRGSACHCRTIRSCYKGMVCHAFRGQLLPRVWWSKFMDFLSRVHLSLVADPFFCGKKVNVAYREPLSMLSIRTSKKCKFLTSPGWRPAAEGQNSTGTSELDKFQMRPWHQRLQAANFCWNDGASCAHVLRVLRVTENADFGVLTAVHHLAGSCKVKERSKGMFATCAASRGKYSKGLELLENEHMIHTRLQVAFRLKA